MAKKYFLIPVLLFLILATNAFSQNLELALKNYQSNDFNGAKKLLEEALEKSPEDPLLLYNLGLTEYKLGNFGLAVALWRKAQEILPKEADISTALQYAETQLPDAKNSDFYHLHPLFGALSNYFPSELAFLFALGALFLGGRKIIFYFAKRRQAIFNEEPPPSFIYSSLLYVAFSLILFSLPINTYLYKRSVHGTVIAKVMAAKSGPGAENAQLFTLKEGEPIIILDKQNNWYKIKDKTGRLGWSQMTDLFITSVKL